MVFQKKILIGEAVLAVVILILAFFLLLPKQKATAPVLQVSLGIEVASPKENEVISSPVDITGIVNGSGWTGFEGQVGTVRLLDNNGNELARAPLTATTEWTTLPTQFKTALTFNAPVNGLGSLVFHNENASSDPARDKTFVLPIKFK